MIDFTFSYADLEFFLLVLVRVSFFIYVAPFFAMSNTPRRVKIGFAIFISYLLFQSLDHNEVVYNSVLGYAIIVLKEALTGLLIGWGAQLCMTVASFAGSIADMEVGLSMVSLMDPTTRENATFSGVFYQYVFTLFLIISGMYRYLLQALIDTFTLIPVGGAVFHMDSLLESMIRFMRDYIVIGFRICLPVFCVMLLLNCTLGILAKVSPQMNMFAVGMQLKLLIGLAVLFIAISLLSDVTNSVSREMKQIVVYMIKGMYASD